MITFRHFRFFHKKKEDPTPTPKEKKDEKAS